MAAFFWAAEAADAAGFFVVVFVVFFVSLAALQEKTGDADEIRARGGIRVLDEPEKPDFRF